MSLLKICGITSAEELDLLRRYPVDLYGLWYGTNGGPRELSLDRLSALAANGTGAGDRTPYPCLVTLSGDPEHLAWVMKVTGIRIVQLHGFALPSAVHAIRAATKRQGMAITLIKVLHLQAGTCLEDRLIENYRQAGVDIFLIDSFEGRGSVGSTGQPVDLVAARAMVRRLDPMPVLLAGGVDEKLVARLDLCEFAGFDIDSRARQNGRIAETPLYKIAVALATRDGVRYAS